LTVASVPTVNDGGSLTGSTVIETAAAADVPSPDVAVYVNPSDPKKSASGV
jgi:hypothetical protein